MIDYSNKTVLRATKITGLSKLFLEVPYERKTEPY